MEDAERSLEEKLPVTAEILRSLGHDPCEIAVKDTDGLLNLLSGMFGPEGEYGYIPDLALVEWKIREVEKADQSDFYDCNGYWINPSLNVIRTGWRGLAGYFREGEGVMPAPGESLILLWKDRRGEMHLEEQKRDLLLALKIATEDLDLRILSEETGVGVMSSRSILYRAEKAGILKRPSSKIKRDYGTAGIDISSSGNFVVADTFTLQWHITQACDFHCRHCYDRSSREHLTFEKALFVLDQFNEFCKKRGYPARSPSPAETFFSTPPSSGSM